MNRFMQFAVSVFLAVTTLTAYAIEAPPRQPPRPWCGYTEGTPAPTNTVNPTHQHYLEKTNTLITALEHCGARSNKKIYDYLNAGKIECSSLAMKSDLELAQEAVREGILKNRIQRCDGPYLSLFNTTAPSV